MPEQFVSELAIYPVKSTAQVSVQHTEIDGFGFKHDRRWMVVDDRGKFISQRQQARLCLVEAKLTANSLVLKASSMRDITVQYPSRENYAQVTVWADQCNAADGGDEVAQWLTEFLGVSCRLVFFPAGETRQVDLNYAQPGDRTAFSDGFPILLISQASLDDLNARLDSPLSMARFRPNVVVSGCEPFAEDHWQRIRIGEISFRIVKPCSRCVIPSIDPRTAERGPEPTRTLISYRRRDGKVYFGQNVIADQQGEISVGMPVEIINR